ncbi:MAG: hypothetical protein MJA29_08730 [Candidatus Omnitrophica bacterium]|nr:hypothetical protein [Candidatus Omnitrophota bacterium]
MSWDDSGLLVVAGCVAGQLENFSCEVLQDSGEVHWSSGTDTLSVVSFPQQSVDTADRELQTGTARTGLGLALDFSALSSA